jgi:hypothetical protein
MEIKKVLIDRDYAAHLLESNTHNRPPNDPAITRYMMDMKDGRWREDTGELIKISENNRLLDGQNRLIAVMKSNSKIWFHIAYGLREDIFDVLDTGRNRSAGDVLSLAGVKNCNNIASLIQVYSRLMLGRTLTNSGKRSRKKSNREVVDEYKNNPDLYDKTAVIAERWYKNMSKAVPLSEIGGIYLYLRNISEDEAFDFFEQLCCGESIKNTSIALLRRKIFDDKISKTQKMPASVKFGLIIKVWNYYRKKMQVKILSYHSGDEYQKPI